MHSFFRSLQTTMKEAWDRVETLLIERRFAVCMVLTLACFFVMPHIARAGITDDAFGLLIKVLAWVVQTLGQVFVFLVDIFLGFARYNGFANAKPVELGWVIVRDLCNMFFIVILLVSAFGTILPFDSSLRYNQVLPKLLAMAVLINFSKTLVQILVDISQVVMLTFVNAFRAAGAGNFTSAFRINELLSMEAEYQNASTQLSAGQTPTDGAPYDLAGQVFASFLLALVLIIVADGVMVIMIAYVLARIIGLWVALIFSPAAFFVTALPGSLQGKFGAFAGKYWARLSGMLTGGPVVMFFIYLTFAILQSPPPAPPPAPEGGAQATQEGGLLTGTGGGLAGQLELYTPAQNLNGSDATSFLTRVGTSDNVASFIVAVALMLMALEAAVEAANAVDSSVGSFANKVGSASKGLAFGAAALAASTPWLATRLGYRTLDKRYDLTGKASSVGLWAANKIPIAGQFARPILMKGMTMRKRESLKEDQDLMAATKGMTANQRRLVQAGLQSTPGTIINNGLDWAIGQMDQNGRMRQVAEGARKRLGGAWYSMGDRRASLSLAEDLASETTAGEDQRNLQGELEASLARDEKLGALPAHERKKIAQNLVAESILQNTSTQLQVALAEAKRLGDLAAQDRIEGILKKDPRLLPSDAKKDDRAKALADNLAGLKDLNPDAKVDGDFLVRFAEQGGALENKGGNMVLSADSAKREAFLEAVKKQEPAVYESLKFVLNDIANNQTADGKPGMARDQALRSRVETDQNGNKRMYANPKASGNTAAAIGAFLQPVTGKLPTLGRANPNGILGARDADELSKTFAGGRMLRNFNQSDSFGKLESAARSGSLGSDDAGNQLARFLQAGGVLSDLTKLADIDKAVGAMVKNQAAKIKPLLSEDAGELKVSNGEQYQEHMAPVTIMLRQLNDRGTNQKLIEGVLNGMKAPAAQMGVNGTDYYLSDLAFYKAPWAQASKDMREAAIEFAETAKSLGKYNGDLLKKPLDRITDEKKAKNVPRPMINALESANSSSNITT